VVNDATVNIGAGAGVASAKVATNDATVRMTDYAEASIGTSLSPRLMAVAGASASAAAQPGADGNAQLEQCLVAILCAHAAIEAEMNEVGDGLDPVWWAPRERWQPEPKWCALMEQRHGVKPRRSHPGRKAVRRLSVDRNRVAHFRGVPMSDGSLAVAGPPVEDRGGIGPVRASFDAARAAGAVADATLAIDALHAPPAT
jgi:hypothetical protein